MNDDKTNQTPEERVGYWEGVVLTKSPKEIAQIITNFEELASRDSLTLLINRREFYLEFAGFSNGAARRGTKVFILYLDYDDLKLINDTKGHDKGDEMLKIGAKLLRLMFRSTDLLARFGGDEYVLAIEISDIGKAEEITEKIVKRIVDKFLQNNIFISIGISEYKKGDDLEEVLKQAESAMKIDKINRKAGRDFKK